MFYFNNLILQLNILTFPLYILRRLIILRPPSILQPITNFIQFYIVIIIINLWDHTVWIHWYYILPI